MMPTDKKLEYISLAFGICLFFSLTVIFFKNANIIMFYINALIASASLAYGIKGLIQIYVDTNWSDDE